MLFITPPITRYAGASPPLGEEAKGWGGVSPLPSFFIALAVDLLLRKSNGGHSRLATEVKLE